MRFALAIVCALISSPVMADEIENVRSVTIAVNGTVGQECALGAIPDVDFGNLERAGLRAQAQVAFRCNVPFAMTFTGARGALTNLAMPEGQGPYGGTVPYSLAVAMPVRHPTTEVVQRTFDSRALQAGGFLSSNGGIAADGFTLSIDLAQPTGEAGLLAGHYSETITVTVSPT